LLQWIRCYLTLGHRHGEEGQTKQDGISLLDSCHDSDYPGNSQQGNVYV
jgi:hypothetical protein